MTGKELDNQMFQIYEEDIGAETFKKKSEF